MLKHGGLDNNSVLRLVQCDNINPFLLHVITLKSKLKLKIK